MASTLAWMSISQSSGLSAVHATTCRPAACAAATLAGVTRWNSGEMISAFAASAAMAANSRGSFSVSADNRIFGAFR
jgi:hypothetical protein